MRKRRFVKTATMVAVCAFTLCSGVPAQQSAVKAGTAQEEDNAPGILEVDDFDSPADYKKYMNRLHTYKDYQYKIQKADSEKNGYRILIKKYKGSEKVTTIPSKILYAPVRTVAKASFKGCKTLKRINVPESIYTIEKGALDGCKAKFKKRSFLMKQKNGSYTAIAQVKIPGKGKDKKVNYKASKVTKITTSKKNIRLKKGNKRKIYTRIYISGKKKMGYLDYSILKFSSSNKKVLKVSKYGNIKALKRGKATIKVKLKTSEKSYKIKVKVMK